MNFFKPAILAGTTLMSSPSLAQEEPFNVYNADAASFGKKLELGLLPLIKPDAFENIYGLHGYLLPERDISFSQIESMTMGNIGNENFIALVAVPSGGRNSDDNPGIGVAIGSHSDNPEDWNEFTTSQRWINRIISDDKTCRSCSFYLATRFPLNSSVLSSDIEPPVRMWINRNEIDSIELPKNWGQLDLHAEIGMNVIFFTERFPQSTIAFTPIRAMSR